MHQIGQVIFCKQSMHLVAENNREDRNGQLQPGQQTSNVPSSKKFVSNHENQNLSDQSKPFKEEINDQLVNFFLYTIELENFTGFEAFISSPIYKKLKKTIFIIVTDGIKRESRSKWSIEEMWVTLDFIKHTILADFLTFKTSSLPAFAKRFNLNPPSSASEFKAGYLICLGEANVFKVFNIELHQTSISELVQTFLLSQNQSNLSSMLQTPAIHVSESDKQLFDSKLSKQPKQAMKPFQKLLFESLEDLLETGAVEAGPYCLLRHFIKNESKSYQKMKKEFALSLKIDRLGSQLIDKSKEIQANETPLEIGDYCLVIQDLDQKNMIPHEVAMDIREYLIELEGESFNRSQNGGSKRKNAKSPVQVLIDELFFDFLKGNIKAERFISDIQEVMQKVSRLGKESDLGLKPNNLKDSREFPQSPQVDKNLILTFGHTATQNSVESNGFKKAIRPAKPPKMQRKNSDFRRVKRNEVSEDFSFNESGKEDEELEKPLSKRFAPKNEKKLPHDDYNQIEEIRKTLKHKAESSGAKAKIISEEASLPVIKNGSVQSHPKDKMSSNMSEHDLDGQKSKIKFSDKTETANNADEQSFNDRDAQKSSFVETLYNFLKPHSNVFSKVQLDYLLKLAAKNNENVLAAYELYEIENDEAEIIETLLSICNAAPSQELTMRRNESCSAQKRYASAINQKTHESRDLFKQAVESKNKHMTQRIVMPSFQDANYNNSIVSSGKTETLFSFKYTKPKGAEDPAKPEIHSSKSSQKKSQHFNSVSSTSQKNDIKSASSFTDNRSENDDDHDFPYDEEINSVGNDSQEIRNFNQYRPRTENVIKASGSATHSSPRSKHSNSLRKELMEPKFTLEQSLNSINKDDRLSLSQKGIVKSDISQRRIKILNTGIAQNYKYSQEEESPSSIRNLNSSFTKQLIFEKLKTSFANNRNTSAKCINLKWVKDTSRVGDNSMIDAVNTTQVGSIRNNDLEIINEIIYHSLNLNIEHLVQETANNIIFLHRNYINERQRESQRIASEFDELRGYPQRLLPQLSEDDKSFEKRFRQLLKINVGEMFPFIVKFKYDQINQLKTLENFKSIILRVEDPEASPNMSEELRRNRVNAFHQTLLEMLKACKYITSFQRHFFINLLNYDEPLLLGFLEVLLVDNDIHEYVDSLFLYQEWNSHNIN